MAQRFLSLVGSIRTFVEGLTTSAGPADAGKIIAAGDDGKLHPSFLPPGVGASVVQAPNGATALNAGQFVNLKGAGNTVQLADRTSYSKRVQGYVLSGVAPSGTATVYTDGQNNALSGLVTGDTYYASATAGAITNSVPQLGSGEIYQVVGTALNATTLDFDYDEPVVWA